MKRILPLLLILLFGVTATTSPSAEAITFGCSKAQALAREWGGSAIDWRDRESTYRSEYKYTDAYQSYLGVVYKVNKWRKIVAKSPRCFGSAYQASTNSLFQSFFIKKSMCARYGNAICKAYPSKLPPRKPTTLADICGDRSYQDCIEDGARPDYGYAD